MATVRCVERLPEPSVPGASAAVATNPASAASISRPCASRLVRPFGSLRASTRFHTPVTVLTPNSTPTLAATAWWAVRVLLDPVPSYSCLPSTYWVAKSGMVAKLAMKWILRRVW